MFYQSSILENIALNLVRAISLFNCLKRCLEEGLSNYDKLNSSGTIYNDCINSVYAISDFLQARLEELNECVKESYQMRDELKELAEKSIELLTREG